MEKITLSQVKARAKKGAITLHVLPNLVRYRNMWVSPAEIVVAYIEGELCLVTKDGEKEETFSNFLSSYQYYNCIAELSRNKGVAYYAI